MCERSYLTFLIAIYVSLQSQGDCRLHQCHALDRVGKNLNFSFRTEVEDIFKEKDRDLDGTMSYEEFTGHDTKTEIAFKAIDKNGDGFVSKVMGLEITYVLYILSAPSLFLFTFK